MRSVRTLLFLLAVILLFGTASGEAAEVRQINQELHERAKNLYDVGDYRAALNLYERILARDPNDGVAVDLSGWSLRYLGDRKSAEEMFMKALTMLQGEDAVWVLVGLGEIYLDRGMFFEALSRFEEVLKYAPSDAEAQCRASRGIELAKAALE